MSSSGFSPSLVIERPACRRVQAFILCLIVLAVAAVSYGGLPGWAGITGVLLATAYGIHELRRASPRAPRYVASIRLTDDGRFMLGLACDPDSLVPASVVSSWTLLGMAAGIGFAGDGGDPAEVIVFRHRMAPDTWRRLAVRLRHPPVQRAGSCGSPH